MRLEKWRARGNPVLPVEVLDFPRMVSGHRCLKRLMRISASAFAVNNLVAIQASGGGRSVSRKTRREDNASAIESAAYTGFSTPGRSGLLQL